MKYFIIIYILFFYFFNSSLAENFEGIKNIEKKTKIVGIKNFLHEIETFNSDNSINVVVEIPAGSNEKWEISKIDGSLRWEKKNNSYRVIKYIPYVANYGFIPQTLQPVDQGGDGDPVDVVLIGEKYEKGSVVKSKIIGVLKMTDEGMMDNKIIAVPIESIVLQSEFINSIEDLDINYPGVIDILSIWFKNYKVSRQVEIEGYDNVNEALKIINISKKPYEILRGYWIEKN